MKTPLSRALNLQRGNRIALTGGGGKTSVLYALARENYYEKGLYTTTTRMFDPERKDHPFQRILIHSEGEERPVPALMRESCYICAGKDPENSEKVLGLSNKQIENWKCMKEWPILVIEADGAAQKPLKAPREGEPVIPECVNKVIGCIGLDSLGKAVSPEWIHRCDLFKDRFCSGQERIVPELYRNLIIHPQGLFQNAPPETEKWVILNKADRLEPGFHLDEILEYLKYTIPGIHFLAASLHGTNAVIYNGN